MQAAPDADATTTAHEEVPCPNGEPLGQRVRAGVPKGSFARGTVVTPVEAADLMIAALGTVLPDHSAVYVSTPITTGPRFLEWQRAGAHPERLAQVRDENIAAAQEVVAMVRRRLPDPVIDPTQLGSHHVPGWEQWHYHSYWSAVVVRFAHTVVFVDGWHLSTGCVEEFVAALSNNVRITDQTFMPLHSANAKRLLGAARRQGRGVLHMEPIERALQLVDMTVL